MYHAVQPDVFVDTHTSNGADYPYTMTLITTQPDKAGPVMGPFLRDKMEPALFEGMQDKGWPMVPYVYSMGETPESGIPRIFGNPSIQHRLHHLVWHARVHHGGAHAEAVRGPRGLDPRLFDDAFGVVGRPWCRSQGGPGRRT